MAHVGLAVNAMQEPLPQIAFKVKQKIGNGIFVIRSTVPHLFIRQLIETAIDCRPRRVHSLHRGSKKS